MRIGKHCLGRVTFTLLACAGWFVACGGSERDFGSESSGGEGPGGTSSTGGSATTAGTAGAPDIAPMAGSGGSDEPVEPPTPCAAACTADNATTACVNGACIVEACDESFFDCDGKYSTGCEAESPPPPGRTTLLSPARGAYTGSLHATSPSTPLRPTFTWSSAPVTGCGDLTYQIQVDDSCVAGELGTCEFASPEVDATTEEPSFTPSKDLPISKEVPVGAAYAWRVRACDGSGRCSDWSVPAYLHVGRVKEDLNGDGFGDVVLLRSQALQVYLGSSQFDQAADVALGSTLLSYPVAFLGDLDGDGFGDLGAVTSYTPSAGSAPVIYYGAANLTEARSVVVTKAAGGPSAFIYTAGAGDLNGDGFADLIVTWNYKMPVAEVRIFYGAKILPANPALTLRTPLAEKQSYPFGFANGVGDLNGDGYVDLISPVGFPPATDKNMEAQVHLGGVAPDDVADAKAPQFNNSCLMDSTEAFPAGDLNRDGFNDAVVVCRGARVGVFAGAATLANEFALVLESTAYLNAIGGFDLDGDAFSDFVVGRTDATSQLFLGNEDPFSALTAHATGLSQLRNAQQLSVSDNDGDGRPDFTALANGATTAYWAGSNGTLDPKPLSIYAPTDTKFDRVAR